MIDKKFLNKREVFDRIRKLFKRVQLCIKYCCFIVVYQFGFFSLKYSRVKIYALFFMVLWLFQLAGKCLIYKIIVIYR